MPNNYALRVAIMYIAQTMDHTVFFSQSKLEKGPIHKVKVHYCIL